MKLISKWALVALSFFVSLPLAAQQPQSVSTDDLFVRMIAPTAVSSPFPSDAGFFRVSPSIFAAAANRTIELVRLENFPLGSKSVNLAVEQFEVLTEDALITVQTATGKKQIAAPAHVFLRGEVEEYPGSHVYLSVFSGYVTGYVELPIGTGESYRYIIQPVEHSSEATNTMIVYKQSDIERTNSSTSTWSCGTEALVSNREQLHKIETMMSAPMAEQKAEPQAKNIKILKVDIECDNEYFIDHGSDETTSLEYAMANIAAVNDIYSRDLSAAMKIQRLNLWKVADPFEYQNSIPTLIIEELLQDFENWGPSTLPNDNRSGAIMLSGINGMGGLAELGTLCPGNGSDWGYCVCGLDNNTNFPQDGFVWDVTVTAHEFGHIIGSVHTHNCSWNPPIDSCYTAEQGGCFGETVPTKGTIMSYCHLTPKGIEMKFHTRNIPVLKQFITAATCATSLPLPIAKAGGDLIRCGADSATLKATVQDGQPPYKYAWRLLPQKTYLSTKNQVNVKPSASTAKYVLMVTDANDLRSYDTVVVTGDNLKANAGADISTCGVNSVALTGTATSGLGSRTYQWIDSATGTVIGTAASVTALLDGTSKTFTLKVIDSVGCISIDNMHVIFKTAPEKPTIVKFGDTLVASLATSYQWYRDGVIISNAKSQRYVPKTTGSFSVVITGSGGCTAESDALSITADVAESQPDGISIRPNPATDKLIVEWLNQGALLHSVYITDLQGRSILSTPAIVEKTFQIDIRVLQPGTYFLHYSVGDNERVTKFIKK